MNAQLPLGLQLQLAATFDNFVPGKNRELADNLRAAALAGGANFYLYGEPGHGKTHLLQAACWAAHAANRSVAYMSLADPAVSSIAALEGLESAALVCIDDLNHIAGQRDWEEAVFDLFNRIREAQGSLCVAASVRAERLGLVLPDLESRMNWGLVYGLQALDDGECKKALILRAQGRGLVLPDETANYLLSRQQRDLPSLFELLDRLDEASMVAQRRLTVPFVREALGNLNGRGQN